MDFLYLLLLYVPGIIISAIIVIVIKLTSPNKYDKNTPSHMEWYKENVLKIKDNTK